MATAPFTTMTVEETLQGPQGDVFKQCYDAFTENLDEATTYDGHEWELIQECEATATRSEIQVFSARVSGLKIKRFKAIVTLRAPVPFIATKCINVEQRMVWDKAMGGIQVLKTKSPSLEVTRFQTVKMFGIDQREFMDYHFTVRLPNGGVMNVGRSMSPAECEAESDGLEHDLTRVPRGHTRGHNYPGGGRMFAPGPERGTTTFTYIIGSDIKGWIPKALVNGSMPKSMINCINQLASTIVTAE